MSDENVRVDVVSDADGELVIRTPEGEERTYYANPIRTMRLVIGELQVHCSAHSYSLDDAARLPDTEITVSGMARFEQVALISVIGEPTNVSREFRISFRGYDQSEVEAHATESGEPQFMTSVGFTRRDWEIGNDDVWFIEAGVSKRTLDDIVSALSSGKLQGMSVGLSVANIYTDNSWAPPSMAADWFLRPSRSDNSIKMPEMARGEVRYLNMALAKADLTPQPAPGFDDEAEEDEVDKPAPEPDHRALALVALSQRIEQLRGTVKNVGWAIAIMLFIQVLK